MRLLSNYFDLLFLHVPVALAQSSSGGVAIRYVLPVLWMTSCLAIMGRVAYMYFSLEESLISTDVLSKVVVVGDIKRSFWSE